MSDNVITSTSLARSLRDLLDRASAMGFSICTPDGEGIDAVTLYDDAREIDTDTVEYQGPNAGWVVV